MHAARAKKFRELHRLPVRTTFQDRTVEQPPQVILSLPDDVASLGFHPRRPHARLDVVGAGVAMTSAAGRVACDQLLPTFPDLARHLAINRQQR